jgi:ATP-dependent DNA ligase
VLKGSHLSIVLNEHFEEDGAAVYRAACQLGCEGVVSKRLGSPYCSGRSPNWVKVKNPNAPAVKRGADEELGFATLDKVQKPESSDVKRPRPFSLGSY